jgi:hypothetical protein
MAGGTGRFHRLYSNEGGSWGKHGFPHGSEPKASDAQERTQRSNAARGTTRTKKLMFV